MTTNQMLRSGRNLRRAGLGLTIAGSVALPVGLALTVVGLLSVVDTCYGGSSLACSSSFSGGGGAAYYGGVTLMLLSLPMLGVGIPLLVVGNRRINRARALGAIGLLPQLQIDRNGSSSGRLTLNMAF